MLMRLIEHPVLRDPFSRHEYDGLAEKIEGHRHGDPSQLHHHPVPAKPPGGYRARSSPAQMHHHRPPKASGGICADSMLAKGPKEKAVPEPAPSDGDPAEQPVT